METPNKFSAFAMRRFFAGAIAALSSFVSGTALAQQVEIVDIWVDGSYNQSLGSGYTLSIVIELDAEIKSIAYGSNGTPYINLNIQNIADSSPKRAYLADYWSEALYFEYVIQPGDFSDAVDVDGTLQLNGSTIIATDGCEDFVVPDGLNLMNIVENGRSISIRTVVLQGNDITIPASNAKVGRRSDYTVYAGGSLVSSATFLVSAISEDDISVRVSDQSGNSRDLNSKADDILSVTMPASGTMTLSVEPLDTTEEPITIRIRPATSNTDAADLAILYPFVGENRAEVFAISSESKSYRVGENIRIGVWFDEPISAVSGTPLLWLNVQNQDSKPAYAVYNAALSSEEEMVFDYFVKPGDFSDGIDVSGTLSLNGATIETAAGTIADDIALPCSLCDSCVVEIQTILFRDEAKSEVSINMVEGATKSLVVTRGGAAEVAQTFTITSSSENGDVISYPESFTIPAGAESASLEISAQWAGTQTLRLHPTSYTGTGGDLVATFTVTESSVPPYVIISAPSSVLEGSDQFQMSVSLSKAPRSRTTVTVSSSNPDSLRISGSDTSVGTMYCDNAVLTFVAGRTGPYAVTLDPRDGLEIGNDVVTITATADKTYSSASSMVQVLNVAPKVVIPSAEDGTLTFIKDEECVLLFTAVDASSSDMVAGITATIDWGDGSSTNVVCWASGSGRAIHTYKNYGWFAVRLNLTDKDGGTYSTSCTIKVPRLTFTEMIDGIEWEYVPNNGAAYIYGISGDIPINLVIPATLGGYPVKGIWNGDCFNENCQEIESVAFPSCYMSDEDYDYELDIPHGNLPKLANFHISPDHPDFKSIDGVIFSKDGSTLVAFPSGRTGNYVVPDGTLEIGEDAFFDCRLESIVISEGVVKIGEGAFSSSRLESIVIREGVVEIGGDAFEYCENLTSVVFPNSLTEFSFHGGSVFYGVNNLKSLTLPGFMFDRYWWDWQGLYPGDSMASITNIAIAEGAVAWDESCAEYFVSDMYDMPSLQSFTIPASMTEMDDAWWIFTDTGINVEIADGNPAYKIENGFVFSKDGKTLIRRLSNLDSEYAVPNGVETIANGAFTGSPATGIVLPNSVTNIGMAAFQGCTNLTELTIPVSVECLDASYMFQGCQDLKDLTILCPASAFVEDSWGHGTFDSGWGPGGTTYYSGIETIHLPTSFFDMEDAPFDYYRFESMAYHSEIAFFGPVEISFDPAGGTVDTPKVIRQFGEPYGELPVPRRRGWTFKGWKPDEHSNRRIGSADIVVNIVEHLISSQTLVAEWEENIIPTVDDLLDSAIDNAGFADAAGIRAAIGGDFAKYAEFREWALGVEGGEAAVVASPHAAVSFLLGAEALFENEPEITITGMEMVEAGMTRLGGDASPHLLVAVIVRDGDDTAFVSAEKVAAMFEATSDLRDWGGAAKLEPVVTESSRDADGALHFSVVPGDGSASSAFLRIKAK